MQSSPHITYPSLNLSWQHMNTTHLLEFLAALVSGKHTLFPYFTAFFVQDGRKASELYSKAVFWTDFYFGLQNRLLWHTRHSRCSQVPQMLKYFICMKKINFSSSVTAWCTTHLRWKQSCPFSGESIGIALQPHTAVAHQSPVVTHVCRLSSGKERFWLKSFDVKHDHSGSWEADESKKVFHCRALKSCNFAEVLLCLFHQDH